MFSQENIIIDFSILQVIFKIFKNVFLILSDTLFIYFFKNTF